MLTALLALLVVQAPPEVPADAPGWKQLGVKLATAGRLEPAAEAFAKACNLASEDEEACYFEGRTLFLLGRYQEAREPLDKALRASHRVMPGRVHRAAALNFVALDRAGDAERHFREAIRLSHGPTGAEEDPRIDYGAFLFRQGRTEAALPLLEQAVRAAPVSARAQTELGRVLLHLGRREAAAAALEKAVALDPQSSTSRLLLGRAYLELGRTAEAEEQLRLGREAWRRTYGSSTVR